MNLKAAVYLVGHGPYREPRLIELQYLRILRYRDALAEKLDKYIEIKDIYIDLNFPRDMTAENLPNLMNLVDKLKQKSYDAVLIDIDNPMLQYHSIAPVIYTLERTGVKVYNCYYDDEDAMKLEFIKRFGRGSEKIAMTSDSEDIITLFPALAGNVILEAFDRDLERYNDERVHRIWQVAGNLRDQNPYTNCRFPSISKRQSLKLAEFLEKEREKRKSSETLYILSPDNKAELYDEGHYHTRNEDELKWAEQRLMDLKFNKCVNERKISYQRNLDGCIIYADPRGNRSIKFFIYRIRMTAHKKPRTIIASLGCFSIPDNWTNDLISKFEKKAKEIINRR